jgi:hypothetical protein
VVRGVSISLDKHLKIRHLFLLCFLPPLRESHQDHTLFLIKVSSPHNAIPCQLCQLRNGRYRIKYNNINMLGVASRTSVTVAITAKCPEKYHLCVYFWDFTAHKQPRGRRTLVALSCNLWGFSALFFPSGSRSIGRRLISPAKGRTLSSGDRFRDSVLATDY